MNLKRFLAVIAALCVLAAPAVAFAATAAQDSSAGGTSATAQEARQAAHHRAYLRNVRLARTYARRTGRHLPARYARVAKLRPMGELRRSNARLRYRLNHLRAQRRAAKAAIASVGRGTLAAIARCESHGNPRAIGGGGRYRGMFQMTFTIWRSVGGDGDPARASVAEQYKRAALLYRRDGSGQWPICGR
jgi:hypothetical protein